MATKKELRIVMFPWLAFGHFIPYLHLSNKLAEDGHNIIFLLPNKAKLQLEPLNLHPSRITFHPITIPHVEPLPPASETTGDISLNQHGDLAIAMDRARPEVESILSSLKPRPDLVLYDMAHWIPEITSRLGIKTVSYNIVCAKSLTFLRSSSLLQTKPDWKMTENEVPRWSLKDNTPYFGDGVTILERSVISLKSTDAIAIRTFREIEALHCDRVAALFNKPILLTGHALPDPEDSPLETRWAEWLGGFGLGSVIFCCLGSQHVLDVAQLQELALGLEMTGRPFLMAVKPPVGCATIEETMPEGFVHRIGNRGVVHGGWVQQQQILAHPSVGCFVTHCGSSSMWEGLVSDCQLVLFPQIPDQTLNARLMVDELMVGVMVEREEDGSVLKHGLCEAIKSVMDEESDTSHVVRKNHAKYRDMLINQGFRSGYIENFINDLQALVS